MADRLKFNKWVSKNNSHPKQKIALREWIIKNIDNFDVLDVYGGYGLMYKKIWSIKAESYHTTKGDSINWLNNKRELKQNVYDVDPYASPFEALEIIGHKATPKQIGIVCTDGSLRRCAFMRSSISKYLQKKCEWPRKSLPLMSAIYNQYPSFLRYVISCVMPKWSIQKLVVQEALGGHRMQQTMYFAILLNKKN